MGKRNPYRHRKEGITDLEHEELLGQVKEVMVTTYKAHRQSGILIQGKIESDFTAEDTNVIDFYDEKGHRTKSNKFSKGFFYFKTYDEKGREISNDQYWEGAIYQKSVHNYNTWGHLYEARSTNADGTIAYRTFDNYSENGKILDKHTYHGKEEKVYEHSTYEYDEKWNLLSMKKYDINNNIEHQINYINNEEGKMIEMKFEWTDKSKSDHNHWQRFTYNEHGDIGEYTWLNPDGSFKESSIMKHEYDSDGKKIPPKPYIPPDEENVEGETEEVVNDEQGNWIKKSTFFNTLPVNIIVREIKYYSDASENNEPFIHPISIAKKEDIAVVTDKLIELTEDQVKWISEGPQTTAENFQAFRYYGIIHKEPPSVVTHSGPYIELLTLAKELKDNFDAKEVHSYETVQPGYMGLLSKYTLSFPHQAYLIHVPNISTYYTDEFDVPAYMTGGRYSDHLYMGAVQILRPSEGSGRRDEYFEEEIEQYISKCTLKKKPNKPVIYMVEVSGGNFNLQSHPVDDNFQIKDLDVNYGFGFEKFHNELMKRFLSESKGLVLFHGQPGTGKTYYIRHLLRSMATNRKIVIYMPPNMVDHLVEPSFMTFISHQVKHYSDQGFFCVLLIEDAEPLLAKRQEGVRIQGVTNLLNMTDGLLNDMLNLQIICTFNVDLHKLDSALLRPGRLIARKEFKALSELDANLLAQRLGIKHHFKKPATLSEVYSFGKNMSTLIHDVESDRDASTEIDDL